MVPTGRSAVDPQKLYETVRRRRQLWRAWTAVHRNAVSSKSSATRAEARQFADDIARHIDRIARQLQQNRFKFEPQKGVLIPKSSGKLRPIVIAPIANRIVQRSILDTLQDIPGLRNTLCAGFNFGGVPGHDFGVPGAILKVQSEIAKRPYYIRTDVKSFFERVDKGLAIEQVLRYTTDHRFAKLFKLAVETEIEDAARYGPNAQLFPLYDQGVAQGSCLSPLLCNLLLSDLDVKINDRGIVAIRYIDDILVLGRTPGAVRKAFAAIQAALAPMGLSCYDPSCEEDKSKADEGTVRDGMTFLGCELTGQHVRPSRQNRRVFLSSISAIFGESLKLLDNSRSAQKVHASYAETIVLVGKMVQGWANTFGFCSDERVMGSLDAEINDKVFDYTNRAWGLLRKMSPLDRRRGLGVFAIADRVKPLSTTLVQSLAQLGASADRLS